MTESLQFPVLELRQTRDLTDAELRAVERDWGVLLRRTMELSGWYRVLAYVTWAFIGFLAISVAMAVLAIDTWRPYLSLQLAVAFIGNVACWIAADRYSRNLQRQIYWNRYRAEDRYALGDRGVEMRSANSQYSMSWSGLTSIANSNERLVMLTNASGAAFIVKAAFEGQDVDGFCAELERRWRQHRGESKPEAAT